MCPPTHTQTSDLDDYNKLSLWLSLIKKETNKECYRRGWIGDKEVQYPMKDESIEGEWKNHDMILEYDSKQKFSKRVEIKETKEDFEFRQTSEGFLDFWTELKSILNFAKSISINCRKHKDCKACLL